jgi:hypothetical protein
MLTISPSERPSAKQMLEHPFIKRATTSQQMQKMLQQVFLSQVILKSVFGLLQLKIFKRRLETTKRVERAYFNKKRMKSKARCNLFGISSFLLLFSSSLHFVSLNAVCIFVDYILLISHFR